jgi:hypothetical protein
LRCAPCPGTAGCDRVGKRPAGRPVRPSVRRVVGCRPGCRSVGAGERLAPGPRHREARPWHQDDRTHGPAADVRMQAPVHGGGGDPALQAGRQRSHARPFRRWPAHRGRDRGRRPRPHAPVRTGEGVREKWSTREWGASRSRPPPCTTPTRRPKGKRFPAHGRPERIVLTSPCVGLGCHRLPLSPESTERSTGSLQVAGPGTEVVTRNQPTLRWAGSARKVLLTQGSL